MIIIKDISVDHANEYVARWHRHNDPVPKVQARFALQLIEYLPHIKASNVIGVAIVGNPCGRPKDPQIIELRRVVFKPGEKFNKIKRWYPTEDNRPADGAPSLRQLPVVVQTNDRLDCFMTTPWRLPSAFMGVVETITKRRMPDKHTMWTYIQQDESGAYLEAAGYKPEKHFTRRNVPKTRLGLTLVEPEPCA